MNGEVPSENVLIGLHLHVHLYYDFSLIAGLINYLASFFPYEGKKKKKNAVGINVECTQWCQYLLPSSLALYGNADIYFRLIQTFLELK